MGLGQPQWQTTNAEYLVLVLWCRWDAWGNEGWWGAGPCSYESAAAHSHDSGGETRSAAGWPQECQPGQRNSPSTAATPKNELKTAIFIMKINENSKLDNDSNEHLMFKRYCNFTEAQRDNVMIPLGTRPMRCAGLKRTSVKLLSWIEWNRHKCYDWRCPAKYKTKRWHISWT